MAEIINSNVAWMECNGIRGDGALSPRRSHVGEACWLGVKGIARSLCIGVTYPGFRFASSRLHRPLNNVAWMECNEIRGDGAVVPRCSHEGVTCWLSVKGIARSLCIGVTYPGFRFASSRLHRPLN
ncbi:MAG: hypothetical protein ABW105_15095, partial [Candidatus Thiodiazotropha sp. 6PLUC1]